MAKKLKKADKVKQNARKKDGGIKATLEERMEEERLKEDIEETVNMVRKRLNLDDTAIPKLHMNIDYLLAQNVPIHVIRKMCTQAPKTISMDMNLLKKKITAFKINSFFEESMVKIFNKNPKILLLKVEDTLTVKVSIYWQAKGWIWVWLMTMSPLYPCGKPCSRRTHHETVKNLALS